MLNYKLVFFHEEVVRWLLEKRLKILKVVTYKFNPKLFLLQNLILTSIIIAWYSLGVNVNVEFNMAALTRKTCNRLQ